ncbi:MAG: hypothetical protein OEQ24_05230 [Gammaproteobacteria bacterium]|nr:hypothetical protein [Gammaproteobacteria bacterium]
MNWLLAILATITSYTLFSIFGLRTGQAESFYQAAFSLVRDPINFLLIFIGSAGFGIATFYAYKSSPFAITVVISIGLLVSFIFSVLFASGAINIQKSAGLCLIIAGIWFIK